MNQLDVRKLEADAIAYLREHLAERTPDFLVLEGEFAESPLEGEGRTLLFSFDLPPGPGVAAGACETYEPKHFVAVGETTPNFFPAYGLSADDAYSFHVGTRFMLEMELQRVGPELEPPDARQLLRTVLANVAPGAELRREELAALFRCEDGYFAVYRLQLNEDDVYALGADCPPGFYKLTNYPPQMVLRLHLGKLIRSERQAA